MMITLNNDRRAKAWCARFQNVPGMPDSEWIPVPFSSNAPLMTVAYYMRARFPKESIQVQSYFGQPFPVCV